MKPEEIEQESFRIIEEEAGAHGWQPDGWQVVRRIIHTSTDFEYQTSLIFSADAVVRGIDAIRSGCGIVTDTHMALAGINKSRLRPFGCRLACHVADPEVAESALRDGVTRSVAAMRMAAADPTNAVFVIGNAPTALFELLRLVELGGAIPKLIIGLPVGFVGAEQSKRELADYAQRLHIPFITNKGRKGGSNVAAAAVNALVIQAAQ